MKNLICISILLGIVLAFPDLRAQSMSAGAKSAYNKLKEEYLPRLAEKRSNIEATRETIGLNKLNDYINYANRAVGVWNRIPQSEMGLAPLQEVLKELKTYLSFRDEVNTLFDKRKAEIAAAKKAKEEKARAEREAAAKAEEERKRAEMSALEKAEAEAIANASYKPGQEVSVYYAGFSASGWSKGKIIKPTADGDYQVEITASEIMEKGMHEVSKEYVQPRWEFAKFVEAVGEVDFKNIENAIYSFFGKKYARAYGPFTTAGTEITKLREDLKKVKALFDELPPFPEEATNTGRPYKENPYLFWYLLNHTDEFIGQQLTELLEKHMKSSYNGVEAKDISDGSPLADWGTYTLCRDDAIAKKLMQENIREYFEEFGATPPNMEEVFKDWDAQIKRIREKERKKAREAQAKYAKYTHTDAAKAQIVKDKLGTQNLISIRFKTAGYEIIGGGTTAGDKAKYGVVIRSVPGCDYDFYTRFSFTRRLIRRNVWADPKFYRYTSDYME